MRAFFALIMLAASFTGPCAQAAESANREKVLIGRELVELPPFAEISDRPMIDLYTSETEYVGARLDCRFAFERITYLSDGIEVVAFLYGLKDSVAPLPTIVFNRGSYVRRDTAPEYLTTFHRLAQAGYSVLAPMYRGSEGADGRDEMGGEEVNDLMQVAVLADELDSVDANTLFLLGESRGGMMVLQAIRDGFPALAAATYGAPTDFSRLFHEYPDQYEGIADQIWPGWRTNAEEILARRSAVTWAEKIDAPLLIMHGGSDQSMPVSQSLLLAERLDEHDRPYELVIFGYENHAISGRAVERDALAVKWFVRHASIQQGE